VGLENTHTHMINAKMLVHECVYTVRITAHSVNQCNVHWEDAAEPGATTRGVTLVCVGVKQQAWAQDFIKVSHDASGLNSS